VEGANDWRRFVWNVDTRMLVLVGKMIVNAKEKENENDDDSDDDGSVWTGSRRVQK
jgi:hypothetical protein